MDAEQFDSRNPFAGGVSSRRASLALIGAGALSLLSGKHQRGEGQEGQR